MTDNIGYAGLALYEKQMKEETPYVALVDAGDAIQGAPIGTLSEGGGYRLHHESGGLRFCHPRQPRV